MADLRIPKDFNFIQGNFEDLLKKHESQIAGGLIISELIIKGEDITYTQLVDRQLQGIIFEGSDFSGSDLSKTHLNNVHMKGCKLNHAILEDSTLEGVDFRDADLRDASFKNASLKGVNFKGADLRYANFEGAEFHGITIDMNTKLFEKSKILSRKKFTLKGCKSAINGFYSELNNSSALHPPIPPVASMLAGDSEIIIESLRRARRYYGSSLSFAVIAFIIWLSDKSVIKIPNIDLEIAISDFRQLALISTAMLLYLTGTFLKDALFSAEYIQTSESAAKVSNFPWLISRYAGGKKNENIRSIIIRFLYMLHPITYTLLYDFTGEPLYIDDIIGIVIIMISVWIFYLSQKFQIPILFKN